MSDREPEVFQLSISLNPASYTNIKLLQELPSAVEDVSWGFAGIQSHYTIVDVKSEDETTYPDTVSRSNFLTPVFC